MSHGNSEKVSDFDLAVAITSNLESAFELAARLAGDLLDDRDRDENLFLALLLASTLDTTRVLVADLGIACSVDLKSACKFADALVLNIEHRESSNVSSALVRVAAGSTLCNPDRSFTRLLARGFGISADVALATDVECDLASQLTRAQELVMCLEPNEVGCNPTGALSKHQILDRIDKFTRTISPSLIAASINDEELGDTRELIDDQLECGVSERKLAAVYLSAIAVAAWNTQRMRIRGQIKHYFRR